MPEMLYLLLPPLGLQATLWAIQLRTRNAASADAGWALSMAWFAGFLAWHSEADYQRSGIIAALGVVWALRLASHLLVDRVIGKPEESRYADIRKRRGPGFLLLWYVLQIPFAAVFATAFWAALAPERSTNGWDTLGILVWFFSVGGETIADRQLARFRAQPENKGQVCQVGLWKWSRHPNYFFEWLHWFSYVLLAVGSPYWILSLVAPALMLFLLFRVSGIPLAEKNSLRSRGAAYRQYQKQTSAFFPRPPKTFPQKATP